MYASSSATSTKQAVAQPHPCVNHAVEAGIAPRHGSRDALGVAGAPDHDANVVSVLDQLAGDVGAEEAR
jgi:hypothetical protein